MAERAADYFFVVEQDPRTYPVEIYAEGAGREVLQPLARLALLHDAGDQFREDSVDDEFNRWRSGLYDSLRRTLQDEGSTAPIQTSGDVLSAVLHVAKPEYPFYDLVESYRRRIFERAREGGSLQEAHDTLTQLHEDVRAIKNVSDRWYNVDGLQLKPYAERAQSSQEETSALQLHKVDKGAAGRRLGKQRKEEYYEAIPRGASAYYVQRLALRKNANGWVSTKRPLLHGPDPERLYGYLAPNTVEFIPVLTYKDSPV